MTISAVVRTGDVGFLRTGGFPPERGSDRSTMAPCVCVCVCVRCGSIVTLRPIVRRRELSALTMAAVVASRQWTGPLSQINTYGFRTVVAKSLLISVPDVLVIRELNVSS